MADNQESGEQGYSSLDTSSRPRGDSEDKTYSGPVGFGQGGMFFAVALGLISGVYTASDSIYRTLRRTDDASIGKAVEYLDDLYQKRETDEKKRERLHEFVEMVMSHHRAGIFSTRISTQFDEGKLNLQRNGQECLDEAEKDKRAKILIEYIKKGGIFGAYTNNGRRLSNETVFKVSVAKAIQQLDEMTNEEKEGLISTIKKEYKESSSSSSRSINLFRALKANDLESKIGAIREFLRDTKKAQRMYQCIVNACDKIKSQAEEKGQTRAASPS